MLLKCTFLVTVSLVAVQSAILHRKNIPVEVRYERLEHDFNSNLSEKVQLSPEELKENQLRLEKLTESLEDSKLEKDHSNLIKNLEEKVQLSPEELSQAAKHVPIHQVPESNNLEKLGELRGTSSPAEKLALVERVQDIVEKRLENLKESLVPKADETVPPKEFWDKLENDLSNYFNEEKNKIESRQEQVPGQTFPQSIVNGFYTLLNNTVQTFSGAGQGAPGNGTSGDAETQNQRPFQWFIEQLNAGGQSISSLVTQNLPGQNQQTTGNSTVLGDSGQQPGGQQPGGIFPNPIGTIQQAIQQIGQSIRGNSSQGDEGTPSKNPVQNFFGSIGSVFDQITSGGSTTSKPPSSEDANTSNPPTNVFQGAGQTFGSAVQNFVNFFGGNSSLPGVGKPVSNATSQSQNVFQQVLANVPSNLIPGNNSSAEATRRSEKPAANQEEATTEKTEDMTAME